MKILWMRAAVVIVLIVAVGAGMSVLFALPPWLIAMVSFLSGLLAGPFLVDIE